MILRRLSSALKHQEWTIVLIELFLVIAGILVALQVDNWAEARANRTGVISTLERLNTEVEANIAALDDRIAYIQASDEVRRAAIKALSQCDDSPAATDTVADALGRLTGDIIPSFIDNTARELARRDQYLDLLSDDFRNALNNYDSYLSDEHNQLQINFGLMWDDHVITHPAVGVKISEELLESGFSLEQSFSELCQDPVFRRRFLMTEIWHQSAVLRMERFKQRSREFLDEIDEELRAL